MFSHVLSPSTKLSAKLLRIVMMAVNVPAKTTHTFARRLRNSVPFRQFVSNHVHFYMRLTWLSYQEVEGDGGGVKRWEGRRTSGDCWSPREKKNVGNQNLIIIIIIINIILSPVFKWVEFLNINNDTKLEQLQPKFRHQTAVTHCMLFDRQTLDLISRWCTRMCWHSLHLSF